MNGSVLHMQPPFDVLRASALCANCGLPRDYEHFDESGFAPAPAIGREAVLARFELPLQYCGLVENFSQYTDLHARDHSQVETPGLQWFILVNNRPLYPYTNLQSIVNPWGYGTFPVTIRLEESATVEFVVRNLDNADNTITRVGGRIVGRYWYNPSYDDGTHRCDFK